MDKVRLGVIGIGNMGSNHCGQLVKGAVPEIELTAVADLKESRRAWAKENLPSSISIFHSGEELITSGTCDAVLVATPHYDHPRLVIMALDQGLHALSEKPAGVYTKQVREMNEVAKRSSKVFGMMFNQRTNHLYRKLHELVHSGVYGQLKRVNWIITDWYRTQSYYDSGEWRGTWNGEGGGVLLNQCPHNLDMLQWICGMPNKVHAYCHYGKWHNIEVEDDVTAYLEFPNGATGVFVTTTADTPGTDRLEITLERARIVCDMHKEEGLEVYELDVNEREFCYSAPQGFKKPTGKLVKVETDGKNEQHNGVLKAFAGKILHGTPLVADGIEGINGLTLSNAMHLSSWLNKDVTIPFDEDLFLEKLNERREASKKKEKVTETTFSVEGTF